ncbi:MAG: hypothetical protein IJD65_02385 [Mailhella sp.]|nr:hypothetical protein [Mailhella sp.]
MKRLTTLFCTALLCTALTGCAYDYHGPAVGGSVAVSPSGVYSGSVSVGTGYYATPFVFPVLPPLWVPPPPRHRHHGPYYRPLPPPRHHGPALRPGPSHRPHGPALRPGPHPGHRPPAMHTAPRPSHRGPAFRPSHSAGSRPAPLQPGGFGHGPRGGHGGPRHR